MSEQTATVHIRYAPIASLLRTSCCSLHVQMPTFQFPRLLLQQIWMTSQSSWEYCQKSQFYEVFASLTDHVYRLQLQRNGSNGKVLPESNFSSPATARLIINVSVSVFGVGGLGIVHTQYLQDRADSAEHSSLKRLGYLQYYKLAVESLRRC